MKLSDLPPVSDVKGGAPFPGLDTDTGYGQHHSKLPPVTNILQIAQIVVLIGLGISWWTGRENKSSVIDTTQTLAIEQNSKRIESNSAAVDKLRDTLLAQHNELRKTVEDDHSDLHDLMTKFRIMVELVDGNGKKPELHR